MSEQPETIDAVGVRCVLRPGRSRPTWFGEGAAGLRVEIRYLPGLASMPELYEVVVTHDNFAIVTATGCDLEGATLACEVKTSQLLDGLEQMLACAERGETVQDVLARAERKAAAL